MEIIAWVGFQLFDNWAEKGGKRTAFICDTKTRRREVFLVTLIGRLFCPLFCRPSLSLICRTFCPQESLISARLTSDIGHSLIKPLDASCGQIHLFKCRKYLAFWTNKFGNLDKYFLFCPEASLISQIHFTKLTKYLRILTNIF